MFKINMMDLAVGGVVGAVVGMLLMFGAARMHEHQSWRLLGTNMDSETVTPALCEVLKERGHGKIADACWKRLGGANP